MDVKRFPLLPTVLVLVLVGGSVSLFLIDGGQRGQTRTHARSGREYILAILQGLQHKFHRSTSSLNHVRTFGPNLTACHPSFTDAGMPIYCCPPIPDTSQEVVDFKLPDHSSSFPVRVRRAAHLIIDKDYMAKYERAVAIMKQLPPEHPHSFMRQANVHCIYCTGAYEIADLDSLFMVHRSWLFLPWHRAFLYFHERILAKLIGDESFALPYWQWDHPQGMVIPDMYLNGSLDHHQREASHLPPAMTDLRYVHVESDLTPDEQIASNLAMMYQQMVSSAKTPELFMGCQLRPDLLCNGPGTIESAPHNTLHAWVGSGLNAEREDMGAFYTSARDPIFYAHHANLDRLWSVWKELNGNKQEFVDPVWLDTNFYFYDEDLRFTRVKVRDFLDTTKLGYHYDKTEMPWLDEQPQPAVDLKTARNMLKQRKSSKVNDAMTMIVDAAVDFGPEGRALDANITVEVPRVPKQQQQQHRKLKDTAEEEEEVLVIHGIKTMRDVSTKIDVYVNIVDEEAVIAAGPRAREFAGTYVAMKRGVTTARKEGAHGGNAKTAVKLGISELLRGLEAVEDESIWVTLVPVAGTGAYTKVGGIRIEHMGW